MFRNLYISVNNKAFVNSSSKFFIWNVVIQTFFPYYSEWFWKVLYTFPFIFWIIYVFQSDDLIFSLASSLLMIQKMKFIHISFVLYTMSWDREENVILGQYTFHLLPQNLNFFINFVMRRSTRIGSTYILILHKL